MPIKPRHTSSTAPSQEHVGLRVGAFETLSSSVSPLNVAPSPSIATSRRTRPKTTSTTNDILPTRTRTMRFGSTDPPSYTPRQLINTTDVPTHLHEVDIVLSSDANPETHPSTTLSGDASLRCRVSCYDSPIAYPVASPEVKEEQICYFSSYEDSNVDDSDALPSTSTIRPYSTDNLSQNNMSHSGRRDVIDGAECLDNRDTMRTNVNSKEDRGDDLTVKKEEERERIKQQKGEDTRDEENNAQEQEKVCGESAAEQVQQGQENRNAEGVKGQAEEARRLTQDGQMMMETSLPMSAQHTPTKITMHPSAKATNRVFYGYNSPVRARDHMPENVWMRLQEEAQQWLIAVERWNRGGEGNGAGVGTGHGTEKGVSVRSAVLCITCGGTVCDVIAAQRRQVLNGGRSDETSGNRGKDGDSTDVRDVYDDSGCGRRDMCGGAQGACAGDDDCGVDKDTCLHDGDCQDINGCDGGAHDMSGVRQDNDVHQRNQCDLGVITGAGKVEEVKNGVPGQEEDKESAVEQPAEVETVETAMRMRASSASATPTSAASATSIITATTTANTVYTGTSAFTDAGANAGMGTALISTEKATGMDEGADSGMGTNPGMGLGAGNAKCKCVRIRGLAWREGAVICIDTGTGIFHHKRYNNGNNGDLDSNFDTQYSHVLNNDAARPRMMNIKKNHTVSEDVLMEIATGDKIVNKEENPLLVCDEEEKRKKILRAMQCLHRIHHSSTQIETPSQPQRQRQRSERTRASGHTDQRIGARKSTSSTHTHTDTRSHSLTPASARTHTGTRARLRTGQAPLQGPSSPAMSCSNDDVPRPLVSAPASEEALALLPLQTIQGTDDVFDVEGAPLPGQASYVEPSRSGSGSNHSSDSNSTSVGASGRDSRNDDPSSTGNGDGACSTSSDVHLPTSGRAAITDPDNSINCNSRGKMESAIDDGIVDDYDVGEADGDVIVYEAIKEENNMINANVSVHTKATITTTSSVVTAATATQTNATTTSSQRAGATPSRRLFTSPRSTRDINPKIKKNVIQRSTPTSPSTNKSTKNSEKTREPGSFENSGTASLLPSASFRSRTARDGYLSSRGLGDYTSLDHAATLGKNPEFFGKPENPGKLTDFTPQPSSHVSASHSTFLPILSSLYHADDDNPDILFPTSSQTTHSSLASPQPHPISVDPAFHSHPVSPQLTAHRPRARAPSVAAALDMSRVQALHALTKARAAAASEVLLRAQSLGISESDEMEEASGKQVRGDGAKEMKKLIAEEEEEENWLSRGITLSPRVLSPRTPTDIATTNTGISITTSTSGSSGTGTTAPTVVVASTGRATLSSHVSSSLQSRVSTPITTPSHSLRSSKLLSTSSSSALLSPPSSSKKISTSPSSSILSSPSLAVRRQLLEGANRGPGAYVGCVEWGMSGKSVSGKNSIRKNSTPKPSSGKL